MRRIRQALAVALLMTILAVTAWPVMANSVLGPRAGTRADAKSLACVSWWESDEVVGAAIENTSHRDLLFEVGVVHVTSSPRGEDDPEIAKEPMITRPLRLAARSVTIVRLPTSNLNQSGQVIRPSPALAARIAGRLEWVRVVWFHQTDATKPPIARRGEVVTHTWNIGRRDPLRFIVFDERPWLRWVRTSPGGRVFHPREDHAPERRWLDENADRCVDRQKALERIERFAGADPVAVITSETAIYVEIETARCEAHVLGPGFESGDVTEKGAFFPGPSWMPPLLVFDADEEVVEAR